MNLPQIDFNKLETQLFPLDSLTEAEKSEVNRRITDNSVMKTADNLSEVADTVMEQLQYPHAFENYKNKYFHARNAYLKLSDQSNLSTLQTAVSNIVFYNHINNHKRYFYQNTNGDLRLIPDRQSRRYSMSGGAIWFMLNNIQFTQNCTVLDPFAGPGNLLANICLLRAPSRIIANDLLYKKPAPGNFSYAIDKNLSEFQKHLNNLPNILQIKLKTPEITHFNATHIPLPNNLVDWILTDPSYGREGLGQTEPEAFTEFTCSLVESLRVLNPNGEGRFLVPSEWAYFLIERLSKPYSAGTQLSDDFLQAIKNSPYYFKKGITPKPITKTADWSNLVTSLLQTLKQYLPQFNILDVRPYFFFPMSIIIVRKSKA